MLLDNSQKTVYTSSVNLTKWKVHKITFSTHAARADVPTTLCQTHHWSVPTYIKIKDTHSKLRLPSTEKLQISVGVFQNFLASK